MDQVEKDIMNLDMSSSMAKAAKSFSFWLLVLRPHPLLSNHKQLKTPKAIADFLSTQKSLIQALPQASNEFLASLKSKKIQLSSSQ